MDENSDVHKKAEQLGTEYVVLGYKNVQTNVTELNGSQFALVACENGTQVTITPSTANSSKA